jgi:hypothetical protein
MMYGLMIFGEKIGLVVCESCFGFGSVWVYGRCALAIGLLFSQGPMENVNFGMDKH